MAAADNVGQSAGVADMGFAVNLALIDKEVIEPRDGTETQGNRDNHRGELTYYRCPAHGDYRDKTAEH